MKAKAYRPPPPSPSLTSESPTPDPPSGSPAGPGTPRIVVDDPTDERLVVFMGLRDHKLRQLRERPGGDMAGSFIGEGDVVIDRALRAGHQLECVLVDQARSRDLPPLPETADVFLAGPDVLKAVAGRTELRDPIACFTRPPEHNVDDVLTKTQTVLVAEGVNNPTNMGVIMRCAAGLGIEAVLFDPTSCDPLYRRAVRVSMGEVFAIPHVRIAQLPESLEVLSNAGFSTFALTPSDTADDISKLKVGHGEKVALVLGAEGPGLTDETLAACDRSLRIPMEANVDSINVGTAAAVAFYALGQARA